MKFDASKIRQSLLKGLRAGCVTGLAIVLGGGAQVSLEAAETSERFAKKIVFTVAGYEGAETLTGFPVLVKVSELIPNFSYADCPSESVRFLDADGNLVPFEIDTWDTSATSCIWVGVPELKGKDTKVVMCYGGSGSQYAKATGNLWSRAGYKSVWHMNISGAVTSDSVASYAATVLNPNEYCGTRAGVVGGDYYCEQNEGSQNVGTYHCVKTTELEGFNASVCTYTAWVRQVGGTKDSGMPDEAGYPHITWGSWGNCGSIWNSNNKSNANVPGIEFCLEGKGNNLKKMVVRDNVETKSDLSKSIYDKEWHHTVVRYDGTQRTVWVDGALQPGFTANAGHVPLTSGTMRMGARQEVGNLDCIWTGDLDEMRFRAVASSEDWLKAEYGNVMQDDFVVNGGAVAADDVHWEAPPEGLIMPAATPAETTKTIQDAIDAAANQTPAGTVLLADGLFAIDAQLMVTGGVTLAGQGWDRTVIKQTATSGLNKRVVTVDGGSVVERVTLTGGMLTQVSGTGANWKNGAGADLKDGTISWCVISNNASLAGNCNYGGGVILGKGRIDHSVIANNRVTSTTGAAACGGGIAIRNPSDAVTIDTCLIYGNSVLNNAHAGQGGGIGIETLTKAVTVRNVTIVGNAAGDDAATAAAQGGAVGATGDSKWLAMVNCVVADNVTAGGGEALALSYAGGVDTCLFAAEAGKLGTHSLVGDPKFADAGRQDYRLTADSPAVDAGSVVAATWTDLDDVTYTGVRSIGCYGYGTPRTMVSLTVPAQANMGVLGVSYDGKQAVRDEQGAWLVPAGATVTVSFVAATGYELTGNPVQTVLGSEASQTLSVFPTATKIVLPTDDVKLTKVAEYDFAIDGCGGIAYSGADNLFYVLRDHEDEGDWKSKVYPLTLGIDPDTAAVTSQTLGTAFTPGANADSEGIVYDSASGKLWISDEYGPTIAEFGLDGVASGRTAPIPDIIRTKVRGDEGLSLESLALSPDGLTMWTANEQALSWDGETSKNNATVATVVRLTRFVRATATSPWVASGQWAYACDKCASATFAESGVSGLCALPDGSLLVLEREVSTSTWGRCRIYRVTPEAFAKATDVSSIASLADTPYAGLVKGTALVNFKSGNMSKMIVYEGITLGPKLNDGAYSVYLVSDGGATKSVSIFTAKTVNRICALKLTGLKESGSGTDDWPADPDVEITEATRPADLAITGGAFSTAATTPEELRKLAKWAKANGVPYGGTEVNGMAFDSDGNPQGALEKAYLFNCAPDQVDGIELTFRFSSITPGVEPVIEGGERFNGKVTVLGAETLDGSWRVDNPRAHFYKAVLTR